MRSNVRNYIRRRCGAAATAAGLALALGLGAPGAAAQTRFTWPDTTVDLTKYETPEQCLVAVRRARDDVQRRKGQTAWLDTLPDDPHEAFEPSPAPVVQTAVRCAAQWTEPKASLDDFAPLLQLYLDAGRDADAKSLLARRMARIPESAKAERIAVSDSAFNIFILMRPIRLDAAEQVLVARTRSGTADRIGRLELYGKLLGAATGANDSLRARRVAKWIVDAADSLTKAERESDKWAKLNPPAGGDLIVFSAIQVLVGNQAILDSLRHSTHALAGLERSIWAKIMHEPPEALPFPVGEKAQALAAEYWFPRDASTPPRPTPGHVSLVTFVNHSKCVLDGDLGVIDNCGRTLAYVRRMAQRFPSIDITIVDATRGHYLHVKPPAPGEEAALIQQWIAPFQIPRMVLAVSATPFWKLQSPDGRRVDKPTPNETGYSFRKSWGAVTGPMASFLIDKEGYVVDAGFIPQELLPQIVDILVKRDSSGGAHAAK
jgi:hypothetical protein